MKKVNRIVNLMEYPKEEIRYKKDNVLHREDGPAILCVSGREEWYWEGKLHRNDGPAVITSGVMEAWYILGNLHRVGGPAFTHHNGEQAWYQHGRRHRTDGPAVIHANGDYGLWYVGGVRMRNFKAFQTALLCNDEHIIMLRLKYGEIAWQK